jgi:outer membrane protein assembly factor BamB
MKRKITLFIGCLCLVAFVRSATAQADADPQYDGRPLSYWVAQASREAGPENLDATVQALGAALSHESHEVRVAAADALAVLGPKATAAIPPLLEQLGHDQPWVRVGAMAALASIGEEVVPQLIETFQTETGGPRIRAAFVLGGMGPDAKAAVPVLAEAMRNESPVIQARLLGILSSIDPEAFPPEKHAQKAEYTPVEVDASSGLTNAAATSADWPQFHGPYRDALCREQGLLQEWPEGGPRLLWKIDGLGLGYSSIAIAGNRLYTLGDLEVSDGRRTQFALAYDLPSRKRLWATPIGSPHLDGPRSTPTVDGERVYVLGTEGGLACLDAVTGQKKWERSLPEDFSGKMMSVWKYCESPLIDGNKVVCTPGGPEAMMVALDKFTGELIWQCAMPDIGSKGSDGAAYSSIVVAEIAGSRQYVQLVGRGVIGVCAETGKFLWGYNQVANNVANVTTPIVRGDYVFATTAYSTGGALLKIEKDGGRYQAREVYFIRSRDFQNHHGGVVLVGDYLYGGHGPNRGDPACIEFGTGKVVWKTRAPARGSAAVLYADGNIIFRYDRGEVVLIEASPDGLHVRGRFLPPTDQNAAWAHPVIHEGKLYLRHSDILLCYDLRSYE